MLGLHYAQWAKSGGQAILGSKSLFWAKLRVLVHNSSHDMVILGVWFRQVTVVSRKFGKIIRFSTFIAITVSKTLFQTFLQEKRSS